MKKHANTDSVLTYTTSPHIHLIGTTQCVVDGLKGILEYSDQSIRINLGKYSVRVVGNRLCINDFSPQGAIIQGDIVSLELCNAG